MCWLFLISFLSHFICCVRGEDRWNENERKYLIGAIGTRSQEVSRMSSHLEALSISIHSRNKHVYHFTNLNRLRRFLMKCKRKRNKGVVALWQRLSFGLRGRLLSCVVLPMHPVIPVLCLDTIQTKKTPLLLPCPSHPSSTIQQCTTHAYTSATGEENLPLSIMRRTKCLFW